MVHTQRYGNETTIGLANSPPTLTCSIFQDLLPLHKILDRHHHQVGVVSALKMVLLVHMQNQGASLKIMLCIWVCDLDGLLAMCDNRDGAAHYNVWPWRN